MDDQTAAPEGTADRIKAAVSGFAARLVFGMPDGLLKLIFGGPPAVAAGLRTDAWAFARVAGAIEKIGGAMEPAEMRIETEEMAVVVSDPKVFPVETEDLDLGTGDSNLSARLYRPADVNETGPLIVYFHGGGWVVGSVKSHDLSCRRLASAAGVRVLSVEYRLAPEHPFPAGPDDARTAWKAVEDDPARFGADPERIAVGGDSAGGNLAAVLCQDLKREGMNQPLFQLLIYPVTKAGSRTQSRIDFATGFYLTDERISWYEQHYLADPGDADDPRVSPLTAEDLSGLAPAYVISSLADPLRDEGEEYAERLMKAGVETRLDRFPLVHAWFNQTVGRSSREAHRVLAAQLKVLFGLSNPDDSRA